MSSHLNYFITQVCTAHKLKLNEIYRSFVENIQKEHNYRFIILVVVKTSEISKYCIININSSFSLIFLFFIVINILRWFLSSVIWSKSSQLYNKLVLFIIKKKMRLFSDVGHNFHLNIFSHISLEQFRDEIVWRGAFFPQEIYISNVWRTFQKKWRSI